MKKLKESWQELKDAWKGLMKVITFDRYLQTEIDKIMKQVKKP